MMKTFFTRLGSVLKGFQLRQLFAALMVGLVLIMASANKATPVLTSLAPDVKADLAKVTEQGETERPRTTGQWQAEKESLEGKPLQAAQRMAKEAADAAGDMADIYVQNAKTLTPGVDDGKLPEDS